MGEEQHQLNVMCNSFGWRLATYIAARKTTTVSELDVALFIKRLINDEWKLMQPELMQLIGGDAEMRTQILTMTDHTFRSMIHNLARMICQSVDHLYTDSLTTTMLNSYEQSDIAILIRGE